MAILPNSRPSTGWHRGYLTNELHKRDFRCRRTKLRYSRTATIKLWRQHLRAQLPRTLPLNPWQEAPRQCSHHKTIGTIPRYPRDPKFSLVKFEKRRVKTLRQETSPERRRDWGVKRILLSDIYNPRTQNIFVLDSTTPAIRSSRGLLSRGWLWYQLVTPTMRLYLPRVEARLRGITALKAMSQVR